MKQQFTMSMFASVAQLAIAKAEYVQQNKEVAKKAGYNVIRSDDGFAYAKVEGFYGKFPEWFDGFEEEDDAWEAAREAAKEEENQPKGTKHSVGPWSEEATMSSDFRFIRHINDANGRVVAEVRYAEGAEQDENLANAKLIKEAPVLLEALLVAMSTLESIRAENPELIADNQPSGWGMNRLRAVTEKFKDSV